MYRTAGRKAGLKSEIIRSKNSSSTMLWLCGQVSDIGSQLREKPSVSRAIVANQVIAL